MPNHSDSSPKVQIVSTKSGGLESYHTARHAIGTETIAFSERGRKVVTSKNKFIRFLMVNTLQMITRVPFIRRKMALNFSQMES